VCLKKDPYLLQASAQAKGFAPHILGRSRLVNEYMPSHIFQKYVRFCEANGRLVAGSKVFIAGFAFKGWPETSDMRDSATLELAKLLQQSGAEVFGYDPVVAPDALNTIPGVRACSVEDGFSGASCIFIMNNHPSYEDWNLLNLLASMEKPGLFVDGWSMYRTEDIVGAEGISYSSVSKDQWKQV